MAIMILAIGVGMILEQAVPSSAFTGFARPPVLALVVAYYALNHSAPLMLAVALFGGILSDCIGSLPPGVTPLALAVIGVVLHYSRDIVFSGKMVTNLVFGALVGLGATLIIFMLLLLLDRTPYSFQPLVIFPKIIGTTIYGAVCFPLVYAFLERLENMTGAGMTGRFSDDDNSNNRER